MKPTCDLSIKLKNGRQLGFAEYGEPDGHPILFFHGLPGSRLDARHLHHIALKNHCRLIGIDRPGMGLSSFEQKRTILSWAHDIDAFTTELNIQTFSILAHSGGAPYAAACAYQIPEKIYGVAIVAGMGPFEIPEATASLSRGQRYLNRAIQAIPWVATWMMKLTCWMLKKPDRLKYGVKQLPEVDRLTFTSLGSNEEQATMMMEAFRQGIAGASQDMVLLVNPWRFSLENIKCPVTVWQGGLDKQAPVAHAEIYTRLIPNAKLAFFKNEGHLSLLINKGEEILRSVCP
ncbi:MAG: alpha/beta hydrolase [Gammaproteobacteria bacterium]|nr:alpha/beta hydrolase [Gammaproteobacteria bacterium]